MITAPKNLPRPTPYKLGDTYARGMETLPQPERLAPGVAQDVLNLFADGGSLTTRPGMVGQLSTPHAAAVYVSRYRYRYGSTVKIPYSTGGKAYSLTLGGTAGVEIVKPGPTSFSFSSSANVRWAMVGKWAYFLDAGDAAGSLWRVDLSTTNTAEEVRGLEASDRVPTSSLRGGALVKSSLGTATWTGLTVSGTNLIPSGEEDFPTSSTFWTYQGGATAGNNLDADGGSAPCVEIDEDGGTLDYVRFTTPVDFVSSETYSRVVKVQCRYAATEDTGASDTAQTLKVVAWGCDSSGNRLVPIEAEGLGANQYPTLVFSHVFDFRAYPEVTKLDIVLSCPTASGTKGVDVRQFSVTVAPKAYTVTNSGGAAIVSPNYVMLDASRLYCASVGAEVQVHVSGVNLSAYESITADVKKGAKVSSDLYMRLAFKVGSSYFYTPSAKVEGEQTAFDTSLIAASLTAVTHVSFEPVQDITFSEGATSSSEVFRVSAIRTPGALSLGVAYSYLWTQTKASGTDYETAVTIEGAGSPFSAFVEPTAIERRSTVDLRGAAGTLPSLDSKTTHIAIWRLGGATPDGDTRARLVAHVPIGSNATSPAATVADDLTNAYYWDASTFTFYDNVPDSSLLDAPVYQLGRDRVPTGCTALFNHAGRLWLAKFDATRKVNEVYGSWVLDGINDYPYLTLDPQSDADDPEASIKGTLLRVGGQGDGDKVVAFSTAVLEQQGGNKGGSLFVLRQSSAPSIVTGDRGGVGATGCFAMNPPDMQSGGGCVAPEGVERMDGRTIYLGATGIISTYGENSLQLSEPIQRSLSLAALGQSRYSAGFLVWHDQRLWAIVPGSGDSDGEAFVYDTRQGVQGWCRVSGIAGFTSGCSLSGGEDSGDLYLGGRNGQIFKLGGSVTNPTVKADKATPAGSNVAISFLFKGRRHGQATAEGIARYGLNRVSRFWLDVWAGSAFTLAWRLEDESGNQDGSGKDQAIPAGRIKRTEITQVSDLRSKVHSLQLSGSVTDTVTLHSYTLDISDGGAQR